MRSIAIIGLVLGVASLVSVDRTLAQSPPQGPLAAAGEAAIPAAKANSSKTVPAKTKLAKSKATHQKPAKTARRTTSKPVDGNFDPIAAPAASAAAPSMRNLPDDPVSFGMKWNGSNDSARDTRVQNYNGDAAGTGAEVGMKLHF